MTRSPSSLKRMTMTPCVGVGPAEDERRAKWQGKRKPALDEDPDIQGSMHAASEEPTEEA